MADEYPKTWQLVSEDSDIADTTFKTYRLRVLGGFIVMVVNGSNSNMIFVPDPQAQWTLES